MLFGCSLSVNFLINMAELHASSKINEPNWNLILLESKDRSHAYYLGDFLRMDDPKMREIPADLEVNVRRLSESPDYLSYKDVEKEALEAIHKGTAQFEITDVIHNTSLDNFLSILDERKIRPGKTKEIKGVGNFRMSWWGLNFTKDTTRNIQSRNDNFFKGQGIYIQLR